MNYERFELSNGLRVLVAPMPTVRSASCAVLVGVGSRWESPEEAGIAHLVEHMLFKGTRRRPSSRAVSETLDRVGGILNAATDKETTAYWTKTASEHVELSLDLLSDILLNSRLTASDVVKEQSIIVEELRMSMDDPQEWVHGMIDEAMWPGHALGRDVAGTRESVLRLRRGAITRFMRTFYGASNAVLVVSGGVDPAVVEEMAVRFFGDWNRVTPPEAPAAPHFSGLRSINSEPRNTEQLHFCLGFPGVSRHDPDRYTLDVLATILGGSATSRLFLEVRERLALAYDIHMYTQKLDDTGSVVVYAGVEPRRGQEAIEAILHEIQRLRNRRIPEATLAATVEYLRGRLYLGLEDTHSIASWLGSQELLLGRIETPEAVMAGVEQVRPADLRRVAQNLLDPAIVRIAAIGPGADEWLRPVAA